VVRKAPADRAGGSRRARSGRPTAPTGRTDRTGRPAGAAPRHRARAAARAGASSRRARAAPRIHAAGVGDLRIGRRIPARYLRPSARPERYYRLGLHADAQTYDGFRFPSLPALVILRGGPYTAWFDSPKRKGGGRPSAALRRRLAAKAVRQARAGAKIAWIVVDRRGITTGKGIGVGSTLAELRQAYGAVKLLATPPDFGRDRCAARLPSGGHLQVWAYFADCRAARAGAGATRLSVWGRSKK
jgi:hypothetical protein